MFEGLELNYDFLPLLDIVSLVQGVTLGSLLIVLNKKKDRSTLFLGLFLAFFSLKLVNFIFKDLNISAIYEGLFLFPFNFSWLLFALFFIYSQQVSIFSNRKTTYWVLLPGILSFVAQVIIFFLPYNTKLLISQNIWHDFIFTYLGIFYSWGIGIWNLNLLNKHKIEVQNSYSVLESREMQWARTFLIYSLITSVIIHILYYINSRDFYYKIIFSVLDIIAVYWISYHGVVQRNVKSILTNEKKYYSSKDLDKKSRHKNPNYKMEELISEIDNYMLETESYTRTELTIDDLAIAIEVHPRKISQTINTVRDENFNTYINHFRIKRAEKLFENKEFVNLSIEGIGNEVGFHSKSAFYTAFKKETGTTPTKFRERFDT